MSLFLLIAVSGLFAAGRDGKDTPTILQRIVMTPLALFALWITIGVFRQGVWSSPQGITVRNVFKKYQASWAEVESVGQPPEYGAWRNAGIPIHLRDGRHISAALYTAGRGNRPGFADHVVAALREDQRRHGTGDSGTDLFLTSR